MASPFGTLHLALRALNSMQRAIEVTGHNVANAATPGYSRQKVVLAASEPYSMPALNRAFPVGQIGTGVAVERVQRFRSGFLDAQARHETLMYEGWQARRELLQQIEVAWNEPSDSGLNSHLSAFWASWRQVATSPDNGAARSNLVENAVSLTATVRSIYRQLSDLRNDLDGRAEQLVERVNDLTHQIADLNKTIRQVESVGQQPNDLRDRRDRLLTELAGLIDVDISESESGSTLVSLGGRPLVMDQTVADLRAEQDPANGMLKRIVWADSGATVEVRGIPLEAGLTSQAAERLAGELGGVLVVRDRILPEKLAQLDDIATALITGVNALHQAGFDLSGAAGGDFLTGTGADDIDVDATVRADPNRVAAAATANSPGDGSIALEIARLESAALLGGGTMTIVEGLRAAIAQLGQEARQAETMAGNHDLLLQHLRVQQEELAGVSLDEETVALTEYQRTYQAAARVMTVADEMLDRIINGTGLVGR